MIVKSQRASVIVMRVKKRCVAAFGAVTTIAERAAALQAPIQISTARRRGLIVGLSILMFMAATTAAAGGSQLWRILTMPPFCSH